MKYIVDIHGEIDGDYDIIGKYVEPTHGIWREVCNVGETSNWACSVCGCVIADVPNDDDHPLYAYCPCCGADMQSRLQGTEIDGTYIDISGDGTVIEQI